MIHSFYKYLILHKTACLPGIGIFFIKRNPAFFNSSANTISPPVFNIIFRSGSTTADKKFYAFLENEMGLENVAAIRQFNDFSYSLKETLHETKVIQIAAIGELRINSSGELEFSEETLLPQMYKDIEIEKISKKTFIPPKAKVKEVDKTKKPTEVTIAKVILDTDKKPTESWWKIAILIAAASVIAIIYYYATTNFQ